MRTLIKPLAVATPRYPAGTTGRIEPSPSWGWQAMLVRPDGSFALGTGVDRASVERWVRSELG